jgi:rod shape determining protein RodA
VLLMVGALVVTSGIVFGVDYGMNHVLKDYQRERIEILIGKREDPKGAGYNVRQSLIAIGSGGLTGKGFLKGTQTKYRFVPEQSTDFIFCTVGGEYGLLGSSILVALYVLLMYRIIRIAERQKFLFNRCYAYGLMAIMFIHFTINMGMTLGLFPVIGIPLPFVSYGGSSLLSFTAMLFVLLKLDAANYAY